MLNWLKSDPSNADVLALQGTAKAEVLAIAKPEMAIDKTKAAGEYCFKSSQGTMVHYASQPEATAEDVVYEFDATQLLAAGLDPDGCQSFQPWAIWNPVNGIFLATGVIDPVCERNRCEILRDIAERYAVAHAE